MSTETAAPTPAGTAELMEQILYEVKRVVVGQDRFLERVMVAMLAGGHLLVEGVPGLAKTLTIKTLADTVRGQFKRIQFTPDLVPADLVGTRIYNQKTGEFSTSLGPVFANLLLADEINRAPAKVQSALLEVMQERQVTIGGTRHPLPDPFLVLATQNPVEHEGTYPLPEAQTDRFLFKVLLDYPSDADELEMLRRWGSATRSPSVEAASNGAELLALRQGVDEVFVAPEIEAYLLALVRRTRDMAAPAPASGTSGLRQLAFGASPRATLALYQSSRALAFIRGLEQVTPALVQEVAHDVLRHRVGLTYEAEASGLTADAVITQALAAVAVPG